MKLDDSIGFLINSTGRGVSLLLQSRFRQYGVTPEQWSILKRLEEEDGLTIKDLSIRVVKDQANVTRITDLLERRGFVHKRPNPHDKRSSIVMLSEEGRAIIPPLLQVEEEVQAIVRNGLTELELTELQRILVKLKEYISRQDLRE